MIDFEEFCIIAQVICFIPFAIKLRGLVNSPEKWRDFWKKGDMFPIAIEKASAIFSLIFLLLLIFLERHQKTAIRIEVP